MRVATQERNMTPLDAVHERLMRSILEGIDETPLVLKGGTALLLVYGLDRFSEDLDFDAPHKLNLESRIRRSVPFGIKLVGIDQLKDTPTVTRYRVHYQSEHGPRSLKLEISYRSPPQHLDVRSVSGFRVASLPRIIDQKLRAAYDGDNPRSKIRDLYDLEFIARRWPAVFTSELASRLRAFAADPDVLAVRYRADYEEDDLVPDLVELEELALSAHCISEEIIASRAEVVERVDRLILLRDAAGIGHIFWKHAIDAVARANAGDNGPYEADWCQAERAAISECILEHGHSPEVVAEAISKYSPGAVITARQAGILSESLVENETQQYREFDSNSPSLF